MNQIPEILVLAKSWTFLTAFAVAASVVEVEFVLSFNLTIPEADTEAAGIPVKELQPIFAGRVIIPLTGV